ncbi:MAG: membrane protein insertase YidC, partial [Maribacter sp.]
MEEKKFDVNSIIGFVLIFGILIFMFYQNQPTPEELAAEKAKQEQIDAADASETKPTKVEIVETPQLDVQDSAAVANYQGKLGAFGFTKPSNDVTTLENGVLSLKISNKGGQIVEAKMKNFVTYDSVPVYLIKDGNASFGLDFTTSDNRVLNSVDLYFEPSLTSANGNQILSLKAKTSTNQFLEYRYEMTPDDYLVDFTIRSQGLNGVINNSKPVEIDWKLKGIRHSKSIEYENRYTRLTYNHEDDKISKLSEGSDDEETEERIKWLSYRQHFFSSILAADEPFKSGILTSKNLVEEESRTFGFTKAYASVLPLEVEGGEISKDLHWYFGPTDVDTLSQYEDLGLAYSIPFGWGIFGWIN